MNDPNGLLYDDTNQVYHMFYQYNPWGKQWGFMSWGHATSKDFVTWQEDGVSIFADSKEMAYSGSAVIDEDNSAGLQTDPKTPPMALIYTADLYQQGERQNLAYSNDGGKTFTRDASNPILEYPGGELNFRDPKVFWYEENSQKKWIMAVSVAQQQVIQFYESTNLTSWKLAGSFSIGKIEEGIVWECPDLFKLSTYDGDLIITKWALIVNVNPGGFQVGSGVRYYLGDFDGSTFTADSLTHDYLDYGSDFYAAVTYYRKKGYGDSYYQWMTGWMANWSYSSLMPTDPWRGQMSFNRQIKLKAVQVSSTQQILLLQNLFDENSLDKIETEVSYKYDSIISNYNLDQINAELKQFTSDNNETVNIRVVFRKPKGAMFDFGLRVATDYSSKYTTVGFTSANEIFVDRDQSGLLLTDPEGKTAQYT